MAAYSTVEPELLVGATLPTVSSPVNLMVASLVKVALVVVRFLPFKSKVPALLVKVVFTVRLLVTNCRVPAPE